MTTRELEAISWAIFLTGVVVVLLESVFIFARWRGLVTLRDAGVNGTTEFWTRSDIRMHSLFLVAFASKALLGFNSILLIHGWEPFGGILHDNAERMNIYLLLFGMMLVGAAIIIGFADWVRQFNYATYGLGWLDLLKRLVWFRRRRA